jgi:tetratricopeptide (TPR) repeat protein
MAAADMLQVGNEEAARSELRRALGLDAQNKLAQSLNRQMTADPVAALGRESFSYTVRPGDTLAALAQRVLSDAYMFYVLARYNDIKVPKQLAAGQVIRLPGKASLLREPTPAAPLDSSVPRTIPLVTATTGPSAPPTPTPPPALPPPTLTPGEQAMKDGVAAERSGDLPRAMAAYRRAEALGQAGAAAKADQVKTLLITRYTVAARTAFTKQDLDGAIANWQRVLDLDPNNTTARSEMERAKSLKVKLGVVK